LRFGVGLVLAVGVLGALLAGGASASALARTRYGTVRAACPPARLGYDSCDALELVPATSSTPDARPYVSAAGAYSTGPAGGLTPADLASAYGLSPSASGTGQTVAIVDAFNDPDIEEDLGTFDTHYGLAECTSSNGCFKKVNQKGKASPLPKGESGWGVEISLDVETVHSVCPSCKVLLIEASEPSGSDLAAAANEAVTLGATEISNSYGGEELGTTTSEEDAYNHPGVVITASAGDQGWDNWDDYSACAEDPELECEKFSGEPNVPAALTSVVAVGGTSLVLNSAGAREAEYVWNDSGRPSNPKEAFVFEGFKQYNATGGGCSTLFQAPSWQTTASGWSSTGCGTKRLDNDISADADPYTGFDIYDSYGSEGWETIGGTSLSSPLVAGIYALAGGAGGVSYPAQTLYEHLGQSSLFDVTQGGSGYCDAESNTPCGEPAVNTKYGDIDCEGTTACDAAAGFDGPSGVGTPNGLGAFKSASSGTKPTVVTGKASAVEATTAVLNATVNPNGQAVKECTFEYGPAKVLGKTEPCSSLPPSGSSPVAVSAKITGLVKKTKYSFRITASNLAGASTGKEAKLKTK
jgi:hypothetical protein